VNSNLSSARKVEESGGTNLGGMDRGRSSGGPNQTMLLSQTISIPPFPLFKSKMTFTSNSSYLGQGDHFPHLVNADLPQPPLRRDKSKKIVLRVRPITVRFTEAGLQDFQVDLRSRIDGKVAQREETTNISINKGKQKERELDLDHEFDEDQLLLLEDLDDSVRALKAKVSRYSTQKSSINQPPIGKREFETHHFSHSLRPSTLYRSDSADLQSKIDLFV